MHLVIFTPAASTELMKAQRWYEREVVGLGQRFIDSVDATVERISAAARLSICANLRHRSERLAKRYRVFPWQPQSGALASANVSSENATEPQILSAKS